MPQNIDAGKREQNLKVLMIFKPKQTTPKDSSKLQPESVSQVRRQSAADNHSTHKDFSQHPLNHNIAHKTRQPASYMNDHADTNINL